MRALKGMTLVRAHTNKNPQASDSLERQIFATGIETGSDIM